MTDSVPIFVTPDTIYEWTEAKPLNTEDEDACDVPIIMPSSESVS